MCTAKADFALQEYVLSLVWLLVAAKLYFRSEVKRKCVTKQLSPISGSQLQDSWKLVLNSSFLLDITCVFSYQPKLKTMAGIWYCA